FDRYYHRVAILFYYGACALEKHAIEPLRELTLFCFQFKASLGSGAMTISIFDR
ncbi:MAG: hypothetical protein RL521_714, partial [Bacteroidota bacterium]